MRKTLMTTGELADILRISTRHLFDLEKEGKIRSIRLGHVVRYDVEQVLNELRSEAEITKNFRPRGRPRKNP